MRGNGGLGPIVVSRGFCRRPHAFRLNLPCPEQNAVQLICGEGGMRPCIPTASSHVSSPTSQRAFRERI
jgi:hypothetical protein